MKVEEAAIRFAPYRHPPADRKLRRVKRDLVAVTAIGRPEKSPCRGEGRKAVARVA